MSHSHAIFAVVLGTEIVYCQGRGIWSLAVSETHQIVVSRYAYGFLSQIFLLCLAMQATGGGDTSIRLWSLQDSSYTQSTMFQ